MAWIKRNLYFLIGSLVALVLMVAGGFYLFAQISNEAQVADKIGQQYAELQRLMGLNPNPGDDKINNIKAAQDQEKEVRATIAKMRPFFQRITPIPDPATNRISNADFAAQLRIVVSQLHQTAEQQSVLVPKDYYFTFEAQKKVMNFPPASLDALAVHLGEVKALAEVLLDAKINSLDNIRREIVSDNDNNPSDYLPMKTVSTPLADITPYEVTFRCFSAELALVMANFANSHYGFVIKSINVEPAAPTAVVAEEAVPGSPPVTSPIPPPPTYQPTRVGPGGRPERPAPPGAVAPAAPAGSKPQVFLTEKLCRVTLSVDVVKIRTGGK